MNCFGADMAESDLLILRPSEGGVRIAATPLCGPGFLGGKNSSADLEVGEIESGVIRTISATNDVDLLSTLAARAQITNTCGHAAVVNTDNTVSMLTPKDYRVGMKRKMLGLQALQEAVGGTVAAYTMSDGRVMVCNDDGIALGLPVNVIATLVWRINQNYISQDKVYGNVVMCRCEGDELV